MRFREDNPEDLARAEVAAWREQNPAGTAEALLIAVGYRYHPDYGVVSRGVLFAVDRHRAHEITSPDRGRPWT